VDWQPLRGREADVWSASPSAERIRGLWIVCGFNTHYWSYIIGREMILVSENDIVIY